MEDGRFEPDFEDFNDMPGIFAPGSENDKLLLDARESTSKMFPDSPAVEKVLGARRQHRKLNIRTSVIYDDENPALVALFGKIWLTKLDTRIRFCRWILREHSLPHDKDEILVRSDGRFEWILKNEDYDPSDYMEVDDMMRFFLPRIEGEPYYALKYLCHFRRVRQIINKPDFSNKDWVGLGRETYYMGELWAEISFLTEHLQNLVFGQKQRRHLDAATRERTGDYKEHTPLVIKEMMRLISEGKSLSNAASITASKGIGTSAKANRALYYRHRK